MMDRQTEGWPCPRTAEQPQRPSAGRALALAARRGVSAGRRPRRAWTGEMQEGRRQGTWVAEKADGPPRCGAGAQPLPTPQSQRWLKTPYRNLLCAVPPMAHGRPEARGPRAKWALVGTRKGSPHQTSRHGGAASASGRSTRAPELH